MVLATGENEAQRILARGGREARQAVVYLQCPGPHIDAHPGELTDVPEVLQ